MVEDILEGYPLQWPLGWKRSEYPQRSAFRRTFAKARDELLHEIRLLGGSNVVISSNLKLKRDGFPYANQREPVDSGIAVYFTLFSKQQCIPCDKWKTTTENLVAVGKTINALRGLERWGAKEMVEAAFTGFQALPYDGDSSTQFVDWFANCSTEQELTARYRDLVKSLHPDMGGDPAKFSQMKQQYDKKREVVRDD